MARLVKTPFGLSIRLDGPVGKAGGNARGDVGAVQFALGVVSAGVLNPAGGGRGSMFTVPGRGPIAVDGIYGPETSDYIDAYQAVRKRDPGLGMGQLPPPNGSFNGAGAGTGWHFGVLQQDAQHVAGGLALVDQIAAAGNAPIWLKALFLGN